MTDSIGGRRRNPIVLIAAGLVAALVAVVAAIFIYFNFIREDAPEAFELTDTSAEQSDADSADGDGADGADGDGGEPTDAAAGGAPASLDGTWAIGPGSEAGYRVVEDLGSIQDFEAVGRTGDITGSIDIEGTTITAGSFEVDVASIVSDDERRDRAFQGGDVMDAANFPSATLVLTEPIEVGNIPDPGAAIAASAAGELTLRDTTNPVEVDVQAQLLDGEIEIVASVDVVFSDYGIANPSNAFVSVRDEGKVEVLLRLVQG